MIAGALAAPHVAAQAVSRPVNILLIVADDHGFNDLGCYGHPVVRTPHLDRLARNGVRFTRCFTTAPLCSPGRGAIMTGLYPHASGVTQLVQGDDAERLSMDPKLWTLARGLQSLGYNTAAARKWHLSTTGPTAHGFAHAFPAPNTYLQQSIDFLDQPHRRPFFLYFCPTHTHRPYRRHHDFPYRPEDVADAIPPPLRNTPLVREHYARYLSETSKMDQEVGALLAALQRQNELDRTLVIFCTDHGPSMHRAKFSLYDWGVRSSLILHGPGLPSGTVDNRLASTIDIPATVMRAAGGKAPSRCQSVDLFGGGPQRRYVHFEHHERNNLRGVRDGRYKLIRNLTTEEPLIWPQVIRNWGGMTQDVLRHPYPLPRPPIELYDLLEDPLESNNLAGRPTHLPQQQRLEGELKRWWHATNRPASG